MNDYQIYSMPILTGRFDYPEVIGEDLKRIADAKVMNVILLGSLVKNMEPLTDVD